MYCSYKNMKTHSAKAVIINEQNVSMYVYKYVVSTADIEWKFEKTKQKAYARLKVKEVFPMNINPSTECLKKMSTVLPLT